MPQNEGRRFWTRCPLHQFAKCCAVQLQFFPLLYSPGKTNKWTNKQYRHLSLKVTAVSSIAPVNNIAHATSKYYPIRLRSVHSFLHKTLLRYCVCGKSGLIHRDILYSHCLGGRAERENIWLVRTERRRSSTRTSFIVNTKRFNLKHLFKRGELREWSIV